MNDMESHYDGGVLIFDTGGARNESFKKYYVTCLNIQIIHNKYVDTGKRVNEKFILY